MGYWVDLDDAYRTMDPEYIESVWWSLKQIFDKGLLIQDYRVAPWCPRCGTGLSDHELAQGYETVVDPSVYVRFPLTSGPLAGEAVAPGLDDHPVDARVEHGRRRAPRRHLRRRDGRQREGRRRRAAASSRRSARAGRRPASPSPAPRWSAGPTNARSSWSRSRPRPTSWSSPTTSPPRTAPASSTSPPRSAPTTCQVCRRTACRWSTRSGPTAPSRRTSRWSAVSFFKNADEALIEDLADRGLLFRHVPYEHSYPHCWRCHTALLYYAQPSWYIRTTEIKDRLLHENESTNWFPETVKHGRYGDWLNNNIDWALSRSRYWGTPLPIWRCDDDHLTCVGSLAELGELTGTDLSDLDPHRPFIDEVTFACPQCAKTATRVPEVIDAWYDSGAMPFAQCGYPYKNKELFESRYPAQFISEAIDQTRGWFYTLMAVGTLVFDKSSYENVVCLGHILAEDGRKMSKHLGNILEPIPLMDQHGADAVRWFMAAGGSPWSARRVGHGTIQEVVRKTLLTYWNTVAFQALYARTSDWSPQRGRPGPRRPPAARPLAALRTARADRPGDAGPGGVRHPARRQAALLVRRRPVELVRPPLAAAASGTATRRPSRTLHEVLETVTLLMAPLTPVHHRAGLAGPGRPGHAGRPRVGPPGHLAGGGPLRHRPGPVAADGPRPPPRRAGPRHARGVGRQDPSAAVPRAGRGRGLRDAQPGAARPDRRGAQRLLAGVALRGRRLPGRHDRQGELPRPGQAVRQGRPGGREGDRRGGRRRALARPARTARRRSRSTARRSRWPPTRSSSRRPRARAGPSPPTPARRSRSTWRSRRSCVRPAWPVTRSA